MAGKSTISITFKIDGDNKGFKDLANSADGLKGVLEATVSEAEQLKKSLINWSQGLQAIDAITNTVSQVGEALGDFSEKMKGIQRENILTTQLTGKTGDEMLKLRNSIKAVSDYFGMDFGETMQGVNALAKGFGITAEEALKLVKDGLVTGANAQGDFIDTLKEYPRYFKEAGILAEEFVAISTNAAKQGIYSDKGVDVIKEGNLRIREMTKATADAMEGIGLSAEKVQAGLASGSITTFQVMQMVASKLNELPASSSAVGTAIADIFGGPGEDAGLEYIKTLANVQLSMDAVKASTNGTAEAQARQIQMQEDMKNSLSGLMSLSELYTNVQPYVDLAAQAGMAAMGIGGLAKTIKEMNLQQAIAATRTAAIAVAQRAAASATVAWTVVQKVLNAVLTMNPIGMVITAVGALVAAVVYAYKNFEGFRNVVDSVWEGIKPLANAIMNGLAKAFEWLVEKCKAAWEWLKNILGLGGKKVDVTVDVSTNNKTAPTIDMGSMKKYESTGATTAIAASKVTQSSAWKEDAANLKEIGDNIQILEDKLQTASITEAALINQQIAAWKEKAAVIENAGVAVESNAPAWKEDAANLKEIGDNIQILEDKLQTASITEAALINQQIAAWKEKAAVIENAGVAVESNAPAWKEDAANLKEIGDNIQILEGQLQSATLDEAALINQQIAAWREKADAIRSAGKVVAESSIDTGRAITEGWGGIKGISSSIEGITGALQSNGNAWQTVVGIIDGFLGIYQGINAVVGIINLLTGASAAHAATKAVEGGTETATAAARAVAAATTAASSTTVITANKLEAASYKELAAAEYMAAHAYIPFAGFGIAMGFTTSMLAAVTAAGIPMLAEGGIASGPTLAMVGEYAGASGNPEIIAPLDKLRGMLADTGSVLDGQVEFKIKGRELVGILSKENNLIKRS